MYFYIFHFVLFKLENSIGFQRDLHLPGIQINLLKYFKLNLINFLQVPKILFSKLRINYYKGSEFTGFHQSKVRTTHLMLKHVVHLCLTKRAFYYLF